MFSKATVPFEAHKSLGEYCVNEETFYKNHADDGYTNMATGAIVFNDEGRMLLVQRAADEKAFPDCWEMPGGKVDDTDETVLHAVARELKEESGLETSKIVRKVGDFFWEEHRKGGYSKWYKAVFEVETKGLNVVLDPIEHQRYLWVTEEEVMKEKAGDAELHWVSPPNKTMKLEAFRLRREGKTA